MNPQLVMDYSCGPFNKIGRFSVSLEIEGQVFLLEAAYASSTIKALVTKWERYGQQLNLTTTTTDAARTMLAEIGE